VELESSRALVTVGNKWVDVAALPLFHIWLPIGIHYLKFTPLARVNFWKASEQKRT
jgi:hypothetical protein